MANPYKKYKEKKSRKKYDAKHVELQAEQKYKANAKDLIESFSTNADQTAQQKDDSIKEFMEEKRKLDLKAMQEKFPGFVIVDHVLLTRHGESSWKEKEVGLAPNAPISDRQIQGIKDAKTSDYTHHYLSDPNKKVTMISSTMLRAKKTALLIAPTKTKELSFTLNKEFTEEGRHASSAAYTSTSGTKTGLGKILGFVRPQALRQRSIDSAKADQEIRELLRSKDASKLERGDLHAGYANAPHQDVKFTDIKFNIGTISSPTLDLSEPDITSLSAKDKIAAINNSITNHIEQNKQDEKSGELWAVFHGGIGKKLYKEKFGLEYKWDYLSTKEIYFLKGPDGRIVEYSPPGAVRIDEHGEFKGVYRKNERGLVSSDFDRAQMLKDSGFKFNDKLLEVAELTRELSNLQTENPEVIKTKIDKLQKAVTELESHVDAVNKNVTVCNNEEWIKANKNVAKIEKKLLMTESTKAAKIKKIRRETAADAQQRVNMSNAQINISKEPIQSAKEVLANAKLKIEKPEAANEQKKEVSSDISDPITVRPRR